MTTPHLSSTTEWRVLTFHGNIHMATIPATSTEEVRAIIKGNPYRCVVQRRHVTEWEAVSVA